MNNKVKAWIELSGEDMKVSRLVFDAAIYVHMGLMCHQAVEKAIKAYTEYSNKEILYIHNLVRLSQQTDLYSLMNDCQKALLTKIQPLYIEARYPVYKERIKHLLTKDYSDSLIKEVEELVIWIIALIK